MTRERCLIAGASTEFTRGRCARTKETAMLLESFTVPSPTAIWTHLDTDRMFHKLAYNAYHFCGIYKEGSVHEPYLHRDDWINPRRVSLLATSGGVPKHCDSEILPPYCYHAILRNDGFIAKGPSQRVSSDPILFQRQIPGVIICLNIHEEHALITDNRCFNPTAEYPTWITMVFNSKKPLPHDEVVDRFLHGSHLLQIENDKVRQER